MTKKILSGTFLLISLFITNSYSQDRLFTYTYQSIVLGSGQTELEIINTFRSGRSKFYNRIDNRTEFEAGLGGDLQTAFYVNITAKSSEQSKLGITSIKNETELSFSNEWKYKISDPVANPLGFALYGEYTIGTKEHELESKIIIDKRISDFTLAFNLSGELEFESETENNEIEWEQKKKVDLYIAAAYQLSKHFHLTLESVNRNVFTDKGLEGSALFAGPGFSFAKDRFWANFTIMPQITSFKGATDGKLNLKNFEIFETRLIFAYAL